MLLRYIKYSEIHIMKLIIRTIILDFSILRTIILDFSILLDLEKHFLKIFFCMCDFCMCENHERTIIYIDTYSNMLIGVIWYLIADGETVRTVS